MADARLELLLHPVRIRLLHALRTGGVLTTSELCLRLPDQPKATVYRHVQRLVRGEIIEIESERRVRGAVERRYRLSANRAVLDAEAAKSMTLRDHRHAFAAAMAALIAEFDAYVDKPGADPSADQVSYRQFTLWLRPAERAQLIAEVSRLVLPLAGNLPDKDREPYMLSSIFFPIGEPMRPAGQTPAQPVKRAASRRAARR